MDCKREKAMFQNVAPFSSEYKKSGCQQVHVRKCFTLEEEAVGTVSIYLTHRSGKTHPASVSALRFMIWIFIFLLCQNSYFSKALNHSGVSCSNPLLFSTISPCFNAYFCDFCRKFGCICLLRLLSEVTVK